MGRIIGNLGLLASIMALSSLIFGVFQEPLGPYMHGIMGGVMEIYSVIRDGVFAGLGWSFSALFNVIGHWLTWLPPAPWFNIPEFGKDFATLYVLGAISYTNALIRHHSRREADVFPPHLQMRIIHFFVWPFSVLLWLLLALPLGHREDFKLDWLIEFGKVVIGVLVFFLLVYAENQIGL